jgi:hypothetical protein
MRPKKYKTTGSNDLFRARLDQIINMKHELVLLADKIVWDWIDGEVAPLYSENGRPNSRAVFGVPARMSSFVQRSALMVLTMIARTRPVVARPQLSRWGFSFWCR